MTVAVRPSARRGNCPRLSRSSGWAPRRKRPDEQETVGRLNQRVAGGDAGPAKAAATAKQSSSRGTGTLSLRRVAVRSGDSARAASESANLIEEIFGGRQPVDADVQKAADDRADGKQPGYD